MRKNNLGKLIVLTIVGITLASTLSSIPAHSYVLNQYSVILGTDGDHFEFNPLDAVEKPLFTNTKNSLNNILDQFTPLGKSIYKTDVLSYIRTIPYDPDALVSYVSDKLINPPPGEMLMTFGHHGYDTNGNYYEPTEFGGYSLGFVPYPSEWAVDGAIRVYATNIAPYTRTKSIVDLPHFVFMIGCDSAGGGAPALGLNDSWLYAYKLSSLDKPYDYYWAGRAFVGFTTSIDGSEAILKFINITLYNSITKGESIYEAVLDAAKDARINVYIVYFTSPTTYYYDLINYDSTYTAAFIGDKNTLIDPAPEEEVARKVADYLRDNFPTIYNDILSKGAAMKYARETYNLSIFKGYEIKWVAGDSELEVTAYVDSNLDIASITVTVKHRGDSVLLDKVWNDALAYSEKIRDVLKNNGIKFTYSVDTEHEPYAITLRELKYEGYPIIISTYFGAGLTITRYGRTVAIADDLFSLRNGAVKTLGNFSVGADDVAARAGASVSSVKKAWLLTAGGLYPVYLVRHYSGDEALYAIYDGVTGDPIDEERAALLGSAGGEEGSAGVAAGDVPSVVWLAIVLAAAAVIAFVVVKRLR